MTKQSESIEGMVAKGELFNDSREASEQDISNRLSPMNFIEKKNQKKIVSSLDH